MFQISDYRESTTCVSCEKEKECLVAECSAGTFEGPICAKCLYGEGRKRGRNKNGKANEMPLFAEPVR